MFKVNLEYFTGYVLNKKLSIIWSSISSWKEALTFSFLYFQCYGFNIFSAIGSSTTVNYR